MHSLAGFGVENYKAFASACEIDLRPLTILFGYNSAGKSALLRALPLFLDNNGNARQPINLLAPAARGASFRELVHVNSSSQRIYFEVRFTSSMVKRARYTFLDIPEMRRHIVERLEVETANGVKLSLEWVARSSSDAGLDHKYKLSKGPHSLGEIPILFEGLMAMVGNPATHGFPAELVALNAALAVGGMSTIWLSALRKVPSRWEITNPADTTIGPHGEGVGQLLALREPATEAALARVSEWYEAATRHRLELNRGGYRGDELFSFALVPMGSSRQVALADTGEGMGQVLPIIGALALAKTGGLSPSPTLAIEHPELHLHPAAHAELAGLFTEVAAEQKATLLVETHSENFILRTQLDIIEGRISPDQVMLYWVRSDDAGAAVTEKIIFDEDGRPIGGNWPPGVFDENLEQARKIALARRQKTEKNEVRP